MLPGLASSGCLAAPARAQTDADFVPLFDGQTLSGWRGFKQETVPSTWTVDDGAIHGSGGGPDLITQRQYGDFELRFEWKIEAGGNSGVIYRVQEEGVDESYQSGIEYQLLDDERLSTTTWFPRRVAERSTDCMAAADNVLRPVGQYNSSRIVARGQRLEHWLNDELVAECVIGSPDWKQANRRQQVSRLAHLCRSSRGHIALQSHGGAVWFRNLRIHEFAADAASEPDPVIRSSLATTCRRTALSRVAGNPHKG